MKKLLLCFLLCAATVFSQTTVFPKTAIPPNTTMIGTGSSATIAFDAQASATPVTSGTTVTWSHTVATSSNTVLFVCAAGDGNAMTSTVTATYGAQPMTLINKVEDGSTVWGHAAFILVAPLTGTHTITVTTSVIFSNAGTGASISFTGVNQSTPNRTFTGASGTTAITVTAANSVAGDVVVDCMNDFGTASTIASGTTPISGASQFVSKNVSGTTLNIGMSNSSAAGANKVMNYTGSPTAAWNIDAVPLIP